MDPHDTAPHLVTEPEELSAALERLADLDPVGIDVERADWDRYWRRAALVQVGGDGQVMLIDPLALENLEDLDAFLAGRLVVMHAMENDLVPLESLGVIPAAVADTAIAAAILGLPTGLEALLSDVLGIRLEVDKQAMQRADWEGRPLPPEMLVYASADVADLPALWTALHTRLVETGRMPWYEEELEAQRAQPPVEQRRHWARVKGVGKLRPPARGRARALWETRERLARETDTAPARILADKLIVQFADDPPRSARDLARRGMRRQAARRFGEQIMAALAGASPFSPPERQRRVTDEDRRKSERLREIRAERARELELDPGLLCPNRTLLGAVMSDPETPDDLRRALELRDWQWQLLGEEFSKALDLPAPGNAAPRTGTKGGDLDG